MVSRSDKYTIENKKITQYSDFMTNFDKNPLTGYLAKVRNEEAVKQSLRNLILTNRGERFHRPQLGSKIQALLFEPIDEVTTEMLRTTISECADNGEPRAQLHEVLVEPREEYNAYFIAVVFGIRNIPNETFTLNVILKRVR